MEREKEDDVATMLLQELNAGDVIEVKTAADRGDDVVTVLVLHATDEFLLLDLCDGSTPFVVRAEELVEYRKFDPDAIFADEIVHAAV
jgi:hypothetical protein